MKLCLGLPYYSQAHAMFFKCLAEMQLQPPCPYQIVDIIGDSLIPRARNTLTYKFLAETDCTHLLFVDSDIFFSPGQVSRLISHDLNFYPVIGGLYPKKQLAPSWVINTEEDGPQEPQADGLLPCKYVGTGFMLISRTVLEEIMDRWPDRKYMPDTDESGSWRYDFWPIGPINRILPEIEHPDLGQQRYLSEDWAFCEMVRQLGHPIVADTEVKLEHQGLVSYPIPPEKVVPQAALAHFTIGQRVESYLKGVDVYHADGEHEGKRLIDVDALVEAIQNEATPVSQ